MLTSVTVASARLMPMVRMNVITHPLAIGLKA